MKLNTLLALTENAAGQFKKMVSDYTKFFKDNQGSFKGVKKTYQAKEGTVDEPSMRANQLVVTTVDEKLKWFENIAEEYIDNLFMVEATNASGNVKAPLVIEGKNLGEFTSLELLRLKSLLESDSLTAMYENIPVRPDAEIWTETKKEEYKNRKVFENPQIGNTRKSIQKINYILEDPNVQHLKDTSKYVPIQSTKDTIIELGDYTVQHFTGEASQRERAEILKRKSKLLNAVIEALKIANDKEVVQSRINAKSLFGYLHTGVI